MALLLKYNTNVWVKCYYMLKHGIDENLNFTHSIKIIFESKNSETLKYWEHTQVSSVMSEYNLLEEHGKS
jgi:hypothetical protein